MTPILQVHPFNKGNSLKKKTTRLFAFCKTLIQKTFQSQKEENVTTNAIPNQ